MEIAKIGTSLKSQNLSLAKPPKEYQSKSIGSVTKPAKTPWQTNGKHKQEKIQ